MPPILHRVIVEKHSNKFNQRYLKTKEFLLKNQKSANKAFQKNKPTIFTVFKSSFPVRSFTWPLGMRSSQTRMLKKNPRNKATGNNSFQKGFSCGKSVQNVDSKTQLARKSAGTGCIVFKKGGHFIFNKKGSPFLTPSGEGKNSFRPWVRGGKL